MMSLLDVVRVLRNKRPEWIRMYRKSPGMAHENIYGAKSQRELSTRYEWVHYTLKYKIVIPITILLVKLLRKKLITKVPSGRHNRELLAYERAFNRSLETWAVSFHKRATNNTELSDEEYKEFLLNAGNVKVVRELHNVLITMLLYDSAYRELANILLHETTKEMVEEFKGSPEHLFYTSEGVYEPTYFHLMEMSEEFKEGFIIKDYQLKRAG